MDRPISTTPARAYAIRACEDQDAPEVIAGRFSLYDIEMHPLMILDPLICMYALNMYLIGYQHLTYDMHVTSPLGHSVTVNHVYRNSPIVI